MTCDEFTAVKHDLVDGRLPEDVTREARSHAAGCAACAEELGSLERLRQALSEAGADALPGNTRLRVMGALLAAAQAEASPPETMTLPEVAAYLRVSESGVCAVLDRIPHFEVAGEVRFRRESLERWIAREEEQPAASTLAGPVLTLLTGDAVPGMLAG